jgi:class 3 adenylate cyclase/tetratricopeptide (TPR) repeat protein
MKFCGQCAASLAAICPSCGTANPPENKFCGQCALLLRDGTTQTRFPTPESYTPKYLAERILTSKAVLEGERKLVTVLFADMKGSMELLADRDPEEARKILDPVLELMMEAVHRYEGTVNQVMGDGIMALFGAPLAHEDHALRACYAALRMQEGMRRYAEEVRRTHGVEPQARVGLNSGEVVVRAIGNDLRMDYTAVGQTTHVAARMEQLAPPGTIRLTIDTLRLAEGFVQMKPLGPVPIKGLAEPVEVFELTGAAAVRTRLQAAVGRGLTRFVGRTAELDQLRYALSRAVQSHGQIVAVVGEPGVGKSRLFYEFTRSHHVEGWLVLESGSVSYGKATSYIPVSDLLRAYFQVESHDDARRVREKVTGKVLTLDHTLEPVLPALLAVLDATVDDPEWNALDPLLRRQQTREAVKRLLLRESERQAVILVIEDLQWIDAETQALLDSLIESLPTARVLLLVNYRPEYAHAWGRKTFYTQLRIDPLAAESVEELLEILLGRDPALASLKRLLVERTEGNPFFLEESVRSLVERRALGGERGRYRLLRLLENVDVPPTVQAVLGARIDRLAPEEKSLLQTASVLGKDVPYELLHAIAGLTEEELRHGLGHLQAAEFLYEATLFPELEYTFKHALTHEVAYASLLHERRRELHARVVAAIETLWASRLPEHIARLAHHAYRGEAWGTAVHYLQQAGTRAASRAANVEAVDHLTNGLAALQHLPDDAERLRVELDLQLEVGPAPMTTKGYGAPEVARTYAKARELCRHVGGDPELFAALYGLWLYHWVRGDTRIVLDLGRELDRLAGRTEDPAFRMLAHDVMGEIATYLGDFHRARSHMQDGIALYDQARHRSLAFRYAGYDLGMACRAIGAHALWFLGHPDQALQWSQGAIALARDLAHLPTLVLALAHAGVLHYHRREPEVTARLAEEALALSIDHGLHFWKAFAAILCGWSRVQKGRGVEGVEQMRDGLEGYRVTAGELESPLWLAMLADAYRTVGAPEHGLSAVAEALDLVKAMGIRFEEAELYRLRGELLLAKGGDAAEAESAFRRALEIGAEQQARAVELRAALSLARLRRDAGTPDVARRTLVEIYEWFTEGRDTADLREAHALIEQLK